MKTSEERIGQKNTRCPMCQSGDTVSTEATLTRDTRHCFGCHRSFDVELSRSEEKRLPRECHDR